MDAPTTPAVDPVQAERARLVAILTHPAAQKEHLRRLAEHLAYQVPSAQLSTKQALEVVITHPRADQCASLILDVGVLHGSGADPADDPRVSNSRLCQSSSYNFHTEAPFVTEVV